MPHGDAGAVSPETVFNGGDVSSRRPDLHTADMTTGTVLHPPGVWQGPDEESCREPPVPAPHVGIWIRAAHCHGA